MLTQDQVKEIVPKNVADNAYHLYCNAKKDENTSLNGLAILNFTFYFVLVLEVLSSLSFVLGLTKMLTLIYRFDFINVQFFIAVVSFIFSLLTVNIFYSAMTAVLWAIFLTKHEQQLC